MGPRTRCRPSRAEPGSAIPGPFSIAAALGGATEIIEADTSGKWLGWAQRNQQLNQVTTVRQRKNDAVALLAKQDDASFDLIICDPPSYANPKKGKRFTIQDGYKHMARDFARVLTPSGYLLACCNHAQTDRKQFRKWLPASLKLLDWLTPPPDFAQADYLKIAVMQKTG